MEWLLFGPFTLCLYESAGVSHSHIALTSVKVTILALAKAITLIENKRTFMISLSHSTYITSRMRIYFYHEISLTAFQ